MSNYTDGTAVADNSLLGMIQMNDKNVADLEVSNLIKPTQFIDALPWFPASNGTQHKWLVETKAPTAAFRSLNNGVTNGAGEEKMVTAALKFLDATFVRDVMLRKGILEDYLESQSMKSLMAAFNRAEYSLIRGTAYDSDGPDGLVDLVSLYDGITIDDGGAGGASVYMGVFGEDDVCGIVGNDGKINVGEPREELVTGGNSKAHNADVVPIDGYVCLQVGGNYSLGRIYNLDSTTGHTINDAKIQDLYFKFPTAAQQKINFILMASEQLKELTQSRTATTVNGTVAPVPTSINIAGRDIRIIVSDAVKEDEVTVTTTTTP